MRKGDVELPKKNYTDNISANHKIRLGELIKQCRGEISLRKLTDGSILSASNLQYIERGINAPTPEAFEFLLERLKPDDATRNEMDKHYTAIRKIPPPDVCKTIINTNGLVDAIRDFNGQALTDCQARELKSLLTAFVEKNNKGEN